MMKQYVLGFMFSKEHVLLIKKAKPEWQKGFMNGVGGEMRPTENIYIAMMREFLEETGITTTRDDWDYCIKMQVPNLDSEVFIFRTFSEFDVLHQVDLNMSDNPGETLCVCRLDNLSDNFLNTNIIPNLKWIIPMLLDKGVRNLIGVTYRQPLIKEVK